MTIIAALPFFQYLVVIADSRISYANYPAKDDILQKLYPIGNDSLGFRAVIGFAGPLEGAYQVLEEVKTKLRKYSKTPVATNLIRDIDRMLRYEYQNVKLKDREGLSFLLAGVEPSRDRSSKRPSWIPFSPQYMTTALTPDPKRPDQLIPDSRSIIKVIGIQSRKFLEDLTEIFTKYFGFQYKYPEIGMQMFTEALMLYCMENQIETVGGLFQCINLSAEGVKWLSYGSVGEVVLENKNGQYIQYNRVTGRTVPLMSISDWAKNRPKPGSFGVFEDPIFRKITSKNDKVALE